MHQFGTQLTELKLVHVEEITTIAIQNILRTTPQLTKLELQNCSLLNSMQTLKSSQNFKTENLKNLILTSKCCAEFIQKLLQILKSVENLEFGTSVELTNEILQLSIGNWQHLKTFKIGHSKNLDLQSIQFLLEHCPNIQEISDLLSFQLINKTEISRLQKSLSKSNLDVHIY